MQRAEQTLKEAGAENVHFVTGTLRVTSENGQSVTVQAITQGTSVWIKASDVQYGLQETAEHEAMHLRLAEDPSMKGRLITAIRKQVTATELNQLAQRYKEAYEGCYGEDMDAYLEEILCDAYAGINRVGARADRYQSAVREAAGEARTQPAKKSPQATRGPPEQYSIEPSYAKKVKAWAEDGMPSDASFTLGTTGDVLQGLGAIESDIYMNGEKIRTILAEHPEMTLREIERIPELLDDPVLILKSRNVGRGNQQNSRLVIFGALKAQNGKPVLSVLDLRPNEGGFILTDMQKVTSAYTKDTNPKQYVQSSEILFADKKRTIPLLRSLGFHMPSELQRSGSIGSISYKGRSVNMQGEKFSDVVRVDDAEQAQFRASAADIRSSTETQERAPELTDADAPVLSEEERQREAWRQMTREVDAEGERLRELERRQLHGRHGAVHAGGEYPHFAGERRDQPCSHADTGADGFTQRLYQPGARRGHSGHRRRERQHSVQHRVSEGNAREQGAAGHPGIFPERADAAGQQCADGGAIPGVGQDGRERGKGLQL